MKKRSIIIILALIITLLLASEVKTAHANGTQVVPCVVTGYYSPLPDQVRYVTGSLAGDKRLNGNGTNGADGTQVFPGMIAAPKSIPFGTKVEIPGYGVGAVHDRGGAILTYNDGATGQTVYRFDIWMGKGDDGLTRALQVGARKTQCTIFGLSERPSDSIAFGDVPAPKPRVQVPNTPNAPSNNYSSTLSINDEGDRVNELQNNLKKLGYLKQDATGYFGEDTRKALIAFQISNNVIATETSFGAGHFGPQTQSTMKNVLANGETQPPLAKDSNNVQYSLNTNNFFIAAGMGKNAEGKDVMKLQRILKQFGYYNGEPSGVYDFNTIDAVLEFQIEHGIIENEEAFGAGYYGEQTNLALINLLNTGIVKEKEDPTFKTSLFIVENDKPQFHRSLFVYSEREAPQFALERYNSVLALGDTNNEVKKYQIALKELGYLAHNPTGYFGPITKDAVFAFQKDHSLVGNWGNLGAGMIGPKTRNKIEEVVTQRKMLSYSN